MGKHLKNQQTHFNQPIFSKKSNKRLMLDPLDGMQGGGRGEEDSSDLIMGRSNGFGVLDNLTPNMNQDLFGGLKFLYPNSIKLDQMITLGILKASSQSGPVKKMLLGKKLKLYSVKEIPISHREQI